MDVQLPDGTILRGVPDGMSKADLVAKLKSNGYDTSGLEPASVTAGKSINSIPRQLGLTARYGLEGLAGGAEMLSEPFRYVTDRLTGSTGKTKPAGALAADFADWVGLPKPEGADERTIATASKFLAGSAVPLGMANKVGDVASDVLQFAGKQAAPVVQGTTQKVAQFLAANPTQQLSAATGAGLAGGASKEAGGSDLQQGLAAFGGGVAGGLVPSVGKSGANLAKTLFNKGLTTQEFDVKIGNILRQSGVNYDDVPERARQALRAELASALQANKELDPAAVSRLLAFKEAGVTPTRGMISQNPVQITREQNLSKIGANSSDQGLSGLALLQNQNNNKLIGNLNDLGANRGDALRAGETVTGSILGTQAGLRGAEQSAWDAAKGLPGYKQPIGAGVLSDINAALDSEGLMPFMNPTISRYMEAFQTGQPFTPQAYKNLQSMLSKETMKGGNEGAAASLAARIMRNADLKPAGIQNPGNLPVSQGMAAGMRSADDAATDAIDAVNRARNATRQAYAFEESSPLVRSVLSDGRTADPQRIAQSYIIGGTAQEAEELMSQVGPQGMAPIKEAILGHLKEKALSGASDETGKFSQAAFAKALNALGERKLSLIFSPEELRALRTNARVASLMQSQPVGSAVNNSNSGALLLGRGGDMLAGLAGRLPFGKQAVVDPLQEIMVSMRQRQAQKLMPGLLAEQPKQSLVQPYLLPALASGGLLAP
jgi:hypothetical protein